MSYHQSQIIEKIGTEELRIDVIIELSERINLCIKQNTHFLNKYSNSICIKNNLPCKLLSIYTVCGIRDKECTYTY